VVILDVIVGSSINPVIDLKGLVFSAVFPEDKVDINSIKFIPDFSWFGGGSTVLSAINSQGSKQEVGIVRTSDVGVFGGDRIGQTSLTVREGLDGIETIEDDFIIKFQAAQMKDTEGKSFNILGQELVLELVNPNQKLLDDQPEIVIFPNPSEGQLNFHANKQDILQEIELYDLTGKLVSTTLNINQQSYQLDHQLSQGVYTARITSQKGVSVKKLQVVEAR